MEQPVFYFGVDYYPEQWPESRWLVDARLMKEAGFNLVRLAEFAWSRLEPTQGSYDFGWLDRALEVLHEQGIVAVLGTPTASPPPWLMSRHPELFRVRDDGLRVSFGNRREYCPNHPLYHQYSRRIVSAMAEHYCSHPAVIGWQIDNEFGERCYCPICQAGFQRWLQKRYGSLEELNTCWGTDFWSHAYTDWSEIPLPLATAGSPNPGLGFEYRRFVSDSYVTYQQLQVELLRKVCPQHFVTHNFMGFGYEGLDYYDLARTLDIVSWDNYPLGFWQKGLTAVDPAVPALGHDTMRGLKQDNFWVMEQQAGPSGWETVSPTPRPGQLRSWAYQSIAHGANGVVFFRWRTARFGTEQYWSGLLDQHGQPGRRYDEIKRMGAELRKIGDSILGTNVKAQVAIIQSYDSRFAFQVQPNHHDFHYDDHITDLYRIFFSKNITLDVVSPQADLSAYKLVVVPALHIVTNTIAGSLASYVRGGGTAVITSRSGVKDSANAVVDQLLPGLLAEVCGVTVVESDALPAGTTQPVKFIDPGFTHSDLTEAGIWVDVLAPTSAEVLAHYTEDYYAGEPAVTLNRYGKGQAIYVGALGGTTLYQALFDWLVKKLSIASVLVTPQGVEAAERSLGNWRLLFLLNHTKATQTVSLPDGYVNVLGNEALSGQVTLAPYDVTILSA